MPRLIDGDALIELLEPHGLGKGSACGWHSGIIDIVIDEISKMPTIGGWISVKERLPRVLDQVLLYTNDGRMHVGQYNDLVGSFMFANAHLAGRVTHWMPLPEPPKEEEK